MKPTFLLLALLSILGKPGAAGDVPIRVLIGKGRVFQTPLGHDVKSFSSPAVHDLLRRVCEWAATGQVR